MTSNYFELLSAATTGQMLTLVFKSEQHNQIIENIRPHWHSFEASQSDVICELAKKISKKPEEMMNHFNSAYWRAYFIKFCQGTLRMQNSYSRRMFHPRNLSQEELEAYHDLYLFELHDNNYEDQIIRQKNILLKEIQKQFNFIECSLWLIYRFDIYNWLNNPNAPQRMSFRFIAKETNLPADYVSETVKEVEQYVQSLEIRENGEDQN